MAGTQVKLETTKGDMVIELEDEKAPVSVANFLEYVNSGFYDGTVFHRVIAGFMVQGGGFKSGFAEPDAKQQPIANESKNGLKNLKYSLSMARTGDPHSATSQFFINLVDNDFLDPQGSQWGYAVFGRVVKGQEVVDLLGAVATAPRAPHKDVPLEDIGIVKASLL